MEEQAAIEAGIEASKKGMTVLAWMIKNKGVDPEALINSASVEYGVPIVDIRAVDLSIAPISLVDENLIEKYGIVKAKYVEVSSEYHNIDESIN